MKGKRTKPLTANEKEFRELLKTHSLTETAIAKMFNYASWHSFYNTSARNDMIHGILDLVKSVKRQMILGRKVSL